jgi:hypothetical protein
MVTIYAEQEKGEAKKGIMQGIMRRRWRVASSVAYDRTLRHILLRSLSHKALVCHVGSFSVRQ